MTTNGVLLSILAKPLAAAGLQRVNISIDTLDPVKFKQHSCLGNVKYVLAVSLQPSVMDYNLSN